VIGSDHPGVAPAEAVERQCAAWIPIDLQQLPKQPTGQKELAEAVGKASEHFPLQAVVHNAAVQRLAPFTNLSDEDWHTTLAINVLAPVVISRALLPLLEAHQGAIVHIGSIHSQLTKPDFTAYATSKAALAGLTRAMAVELGARVRVNAVDPAAIKTPMLEAGFAADPEQLAQLGHCHPTGAIGCAADVARAVLFLIDPANSFVNGCILPLGGGIHNRLHDPK
jgi:NAD(P)-dependent dehydrogenase (short-subunit alcohol dehydrogenase family)